MAYGKNFDFKSHPWESFIFFDIETVAGNKELEANTPEYDAFKYKMRYSEEAKAKDFNVNYIQALYKEKAALYPEFGKIVTISVGALNDKGRLQVFSFKGNNEKAILIDFNGWLSDKVKNNANTALCGINIKVFDLRYIFIRSIVHGVEPVAKHIDFTGLKPWEMNVADLTDNWKQGSFYNAPLIAIAYSLGLPSPKDDIDGSQVSATYYNEMKGDKGLERIASYCERDVVTTANVARKLRLEDVLEVDIHPTRHRTIKNVDAPKGTNKVIKDKELAPLLKLLYDTNDFSSIEDKLRKHIKRKKVFKKDFEIIGNILKGIYIRTDFVNQDQDSKAIKEEKNTEIDEFINSLK